MSLEIVIKIPKEAILKKQEAIKVGMQKGIAYATGEITNKAVANAPRVYGTLKRSIHAEITGELGGGFTGRVIQDSKVAKYGVWVHEGTGIYGPHGTPIVPVKAKMLRWKTRDGKVMVKRSVKGQKPNPYMKKAFDELKGEVPIMIKTTIMAELDK